MAEKIAHFHTVWTAKTCGRLLSIRPSIGRRKKLHKYFDGHNCKISKKVTCFQILRRTFNTGRFLSICCGNSDFQCCQLIVWKSHNFPVTQILREINSRDSTSAKSAILTQLEALNLDFHELLHFLKVEIDQN